MGVTATITKAVEAVGQRAGWLPSEIEKKRKARREFLAGKLPSEADEIEKFKTLSREGEEKRRLIAIGELYQGADRQVNQLYENQRLVVEGIKAVKTELRNTAAIEDREVYRRARQKEIAKRTHDQLLVRSIADAERGLSALKANVVAANANVSSDKHLNIDERGRKQLASEVELAEFTLRQAEFDHQDLIDQRDEIQADLIELQQVVAAAEAKMLLP